MTTTDDPVSDPQRYLAWAMQCMIGARTACRIAYQLLEGDREQAALPDLLADINAAIASVSYEYFQLTGELLDSDEITQGALWKS